MRRMNRSLAMAAVFFMAASFSTSAQKVLTIERALEIAETNSPELKTSLYNLERSELLLLAQKASLKSQFSLSLNPVSYTQTRSFDQRVSQWYTNKIFNTSGTFRIEQPIIWTNATLSLINTFGWQNNESTTANGTTTNKAFSNTLRLQLSQPIFTYNSQKMELEELEYDYENMYISYALQRLNLERSITSQFYAVYTAQDNLQISRDELANAEQNYQIIKDKVDADLLAREELFQAELNLASARSTVNNRIVSLENAKDNLKKILGLPLEEEISTIAQIDSVKTVKIDVDKAVENALNTRLELRQREIQTDLLEFQLIRTKAQNEFSGNINLSLGVMGDNEEFGNIYKNPTNSPSVEVSFNVPIFDWGANKKRVKAQEKSIQLNQLEAEEEIKDIQIEIRQTCRSLDNLVAEIEIARQSVENAQHTYELNAEKYRNGTITGMDMSQFQNQLSSQKMSYAQSLINYKIELLNLKILTLYNFETNTAITPINSDAIKTHTRK